MTEMQKAHNLLKSVGAESKHTKSVNHMGVESYISYAVYLISSSPVSQAVGYALVVILVAAIARWVAQIGDGALRWLMSSSPLTLRAMQVAVVLGVYLSILTIMVTLPDATARTILGRGVPQAPPGAENDLTRFLVSELSKADQIPWLGTLFAVDDTRLSPPKSLVTRSNAIRAVLTSNHGCVDELSARPHQNRAAWDALIADVERSAATLAAAQPSLAQTVAANASQIVASLQTSWPNSRKESFWSTGFRMSPYNFATLAAQMLRCSHDIPRSRALLRNLEVDKFRNQNLAAYFRANLDRLLTTNFTRAPSPLPGGLTGLDLALARRSSGGRAAWDAEMKRIDTLVDNALPLPPELSWTEPSTATDDFPPGLDLFYALRVVDGNSLESSSVVFSAFLRGAMPIEIGKPSGDDDQDVFDRVFGLGFLDNSDAMRRRHGYRAIVYNRANSAVYMRLGAIELGAISFFAILVWLSSGVLFRVPASLQAEAAETPNGEHGARAGGRGSGNA